MSDLTTEALTKIASETSLPYSTVRYCLECSVAQAVCEFFGVRDCEVDLDARTVIPAFYVGGDMDVEEAELFTSAPVRHDVVPAEFTFDMFRRDFVDRTLELFSGILREVEADELEKKWRKQVRKAVEGVIREKSKDRIEVDLGDDTNGIMLKPEWTPLEVSSYREGKLMLFYVLKVVRRGSAVDVYLSRGVPGFPGAILKMLAPWVTVKTVRRLRGRKTWLKVRPSVNPDLLRDVSSHLMGEVVEMVRH
ncbi:MAG: hypothetical protein DRG59_06935 [Deltaproteobacteria bacterium]|nr:MAG: hypothetical protein DRG59_06935 [Deltaproteobacteria bacterium]